MYIFVANESPLDQGVWFDDFTVEVTKSKVTAVSDYYPFGMLQAGNSTNSGDPTGNKYLYNGKELQEDLGLQWYDYGARMYQADLGRWGVIDPMFDRHYDWSPYVYVLDNPIINVDLYGYTDWAMVLKGVATAVGGVGGTVAGVGLVLTPTGVGQVGGAGLMAVSVPATGLGVGMIVAGFVDNGTGEKIPGGVGEAIGMAGDKVVGNENGELRAVGAVGDIATNVSLGGLPKTAVKQIALGVQVTKTAEDVVNIVESEKEPETSNDTKVIPTIEEVIEKDKLVEQDNTRVQIPLRRDFEK